MARTRGPSAGQRLRAASTVRPQVVAADRRAWTRTSASPNSISRASGTSSTRTSPAPYMTVARTKHPPSKSAPFGAVGWLPSRYPRPRRVNRHPIHRSSTRPHATCRRRSRTCQQCRRTPLSIEPIRIPIRQEAADQEGKDAAPSRITVGIAILPPAAFDQRPAVAPRSTSTTPSRTHAG